MKYFDKALKLFFFCCFFSLVYCNCFSQTKNDNLGNDALLMKLRDSLPNGYSIYKNADNLYIENKDSMWVLSENNINAPISGSKTQDEEIQRIKKYGHKTKAKLVYRCESKWSSDKLKKSHQHNDSIFALINNLPDKYNIRKFFNMPSKDDSFFGQAKTTEDEKNIELYRKEKTKLENLLVIIPTYQSEQYALFLIEVVGVEDEFNTVLPFETSTEIYQIQDKMMKSLPVINK